MRIVLFYHSLCSDWNHGNAHFLRGVATELIDRGHDVRIFEPADGWSLRNLRAEQGEAARFSFQRAYPNLRSQFYDLATLDLDDVLDGADLVIVHEWNDHDLVARIGAYRANHPGFRLLFHDTHHRSVSDPSQMQRYDLRHYDGVLAFGEVIRRIYLERGWAEHAWTWHEAADVRVFKPMERDLTADLVWIGNWGDGERAEQLQEYIFEPVHALELSATVHGVRYPPHALDMLQSAGAHYCGWLPNFEAPRVFARHRFTVHVPRQFYVTSLPGIPTLRPFEAMACGIPLLSAPWDDCEGLFRRGRDYLIAHDGREMQQLMRAVLEDYDLAQELAQNGRETILLRHTCAHRVHELMQICDSLGVDSTPSTEPVGKLPAE